MDHCEHTDLDANVNCERLIVAAGHPPAYSATVRVTCRGCGGEFTFMPLPLGAVFDGGKGVMLRMEPPDRE